MPPVSTSVKSPGRIFKVVKGQVGPWPKDHAFTESEFKRLNPLPTGDAAKSIDTESYHDALFKRLVDLGSIVNSPDSVPGVTPIGPASNPPNQHIAGNPAIAAAVKAELERREALMPQGMTQIVTGAVK